MNWLFICSKNRWRSLTAEKIFKKLSSHSVRSAGTDADARVKVTASQLKWADVIFVMEKKHQELLQLKFRSELTAKEVVILDIPDDYQYMDPELVTILEESVKAYLIDAPLGFEPR